MGGGNEPSHTKPVRRTKTKAFSRIKLKRNTRAYRLLIFSFSTVLHSPETEGNVRSTLVLCKKIPEYSQLADESYFNLKFIYTNKWFFKIFKLFHVW